MFSFCMVTCTCTCINYVQAVPISQVAESKVEQEESVSILQDDHKSL